MVWGVEVSNILFMFCICVNMIGPRTLQMRDEDTVVA